MLENQMVLPHCDDDMPSYEIPSGIEIYKSLPNKLANELLLDNAGEAFENTGKTYIEAIADAGRMRNVAVLLRAIDSLVDAVGNEPAAIDYWMRMGK